MIACNGCRMRESEVARLYGDMLWTCGFRRDYLDASVEAAKKLAKEGKVTTLTGCAVAIAPERFAGLGPLYPWKDHPEMRGPIFLPKKANPTRFCDKFNCLLIQEGCPFECAYCSERLAFPPLQSIPLANLLDAIPENCKELMLIGDCPGAWTYNGLSFDNLLFAFSQKLHIWNLHPRHAKEYLLSLMQLKRAGRLGHLNIPIQSGANETLLRMRREYAQSDLLNLFACLHSFGITDIETHIIIGFPGETTIDFMDTLAVLEVIKPSYILASRCMLLDKQIAELGEPADSRTMDARCEALAKMCARMGIVCNVEGTKFADERTKI